MRQKREKASRAICSGKSLHAGTPSNSAIKSWWNSSTISLRPPDSFGSSSSMLRKRALSQHGTLAMIFRTRFRASSCRYPSKFSSRPYAMRLPRLIRQELESPYLLQSTSPRAGQVSARCALGVGCQACLQQFPVIPAKPCHQAREALMREDLPMVMSWQFRTGDPRQMYQSNEQICTIVKQQVFLRDRKSLTESESNIQTITSSRKKLLRERSP